MEDGGGCSGGSCDERDDEESSFAEAVGESSAVWEVEDGRGVLDEDDGIEELTRLMKEWRAR